MKAGTWRPKDHKKVITGKFSEILARTGLEDFYKQMGHIQIKLYIMILINPS